MIVHKALHIFIRPDDKRPLAGRTTHKKNDNGSVEKAFRSSSFLRLLFGVPPKYNTYVKIHRKFIRVGTHVESKSNTAL